MYPYIIMKYFCYLFSLLLFAVSAVSAAENTPATVLDTSNIKAGCWVEYHLVIDEMSADKLEFDCFVKLYGVSGDMLDFEYRISGIGKRMQISRNDFPLSRLIEKIGRATSYKESSEETVVLAAMDNQKVQTVHDVWNYENGVTEVWRSADVPFSVVRVVCKGFNLELRAYSWAEE